MDIQIEGVFIKVSQLLKKLNLIDSGGQAKTFLLKNKVTINDLPTQARGAKVRVGDVIWINDNVYKIIGSE